MASKDSIKYALGKFAEAKLDHLPNHFVSNVKSKLDKIVDDRFSKDPVLHKFMLKTSRINLLTFN